MAKVTPSQERRPTRGSEPTARSSLDPAVAWSVTLHVLAFPWFVAMLIGLALVVSAMGIEMGGPEDRGTQALLFVGFLLLTLAPLAASAVIGLRAWRLRRRRGALVAGAVSIAVGVLVLVFSGTVFLGAAGA